MNVITSKDIFYINALLSDTTDGLPKPTSQFTSLVHDLIIGATNVPGPAMGALSYYIHQALQSSDVILGRPRTQNKHYYTTSAYYLLSTTNEYLTLERNTNMTRTYTRTPRILYRVP